MYVYWTMFAVPALSTLLLGTRRLGATGRLAPGFLLILILFTALVGLRYQIGTDWFNYQRIFDDLHYADFRGALASKDIGFGVLVWVANRLGSGVYITNVVCAAIMMYGIARFAAAQPDRWMALTAAVPYLIIVVGMGYTRQATAIGFVLLAILAFQESRLGWTIGHVIIAALFHGGSLCVLPFFAAVLMWKNKRLIIPLVFASAILYAGLLSQRLNNLYGLYITREEAFDSSGALIRLTMNVIPSLLFLLMRRRFDLDKDTELFWTLFSWASIVLLMILPFFPSTTAIDRIAIYMIPVQLFLFGHLPVTFGQTQQGARTISYVSILYYGAALFIWLQFATNSRNWLPYKIAISF